MFDLRINGIQSALLVGSKLIVIGTIVVMLVYFAHELLYPLPTAEKVS